MLLTGLQKGKVGRSVIDIDQTKRYVVVVLNVVQQ